MGAGYVVFARRLVDTLFIVPLNAESKYSVLTVGGKHCKAGIQKTEEVLVVVGNRAVHRKEHPRFDMAEQCRRTWVFKLYIHERVKNKLGNSRC